MATADGARAAAKPPSSTQYHRFRGGERCEECGARQWYAEDALRYCRNGHRLEGFAAHEEDEDAFGTQGRVSRRRRDRDAERADARKRSSVKLAGHAATALYLEVLQLVLRRQVRALRRHRGGGAAAAPRPLRSAGSRTARPDGGSRNNDDDDDDDDDDDLERVVRSLWALRVKALSLKAEEGAGTRRSDSEDGASSGGGGSLFASSSASEPDASQWSDSEGGAADVSAGAGTRARWKKLPGPIDALALCYLGCLVKRLPVTTADLHRWAQRGDIEFLAAINNIPKNVRDRLPAEYHRALQVRDHIRPGHLQTTVQQLVIFFHANFDLVFPPLNYAPILVRHIKDLLLPAETYLAAGCLAEILGANFSYPQSGTIWSMSRPEVLLAALVVVSAKLLYALDGVERAPRSAQDPRCLRPDWVAWREAVEGRDRDRAQGGRHLERGREYEVAPNDALSMDKTKLDDYMDWFERMWIGDAEPHTAEVLREPFVDPKGPPPPPSPSAGVHHAMGDAARAADDDSDDGQAVRRWRATGRTTRAVNPASEDEEGEEDEEGGETRRLPRDFCPVWRSEDDLPETARALYREAAALAAVPTATLVRAAAQVEHRLEVWGLRRAQRGRDKGKGKGKERERGKGKGKGRGKEGPIIPDGATTDSDF